VSTVAPPLAPDLVAGLRRLKLAAVRRLAPDICQTAKTQRWAPEELLRTLIEAELSARDRSNRMARLKQAAFPVTKTLDEFKVQLSSVPEPTFRYLASLEWIRAHENLCLVGPAGTGKSHLLVGLGHAAVAAGFRVRYFTAAELVETLYRGLADNSVGRVIDRFRDCQIGSGFDRRAVPVPRYLPELDRQRCLVGECRKRWSEPGLGEDRRVDAMR